jgi:hypothetical protein
MRRVRHRCLLRDQFLATDFWRPISGGGLALGVAGMHEAGVDVCAVPAPLFRFLSSAKRGVKRVQGIRDGVDVCASSPHLSFLWSTECETGDG